MHILLTYFLMLDNELADSVPKSNTLKNLPNRNLRYAKPLLLRRGKMTYPIYNEWLVVVR